MKPANNKERQPFLVTGWCACWLLFAAFQAIPLSAQNQDEGLRIKERITGFEMRTTSGPSSIPFRTGVDVEVKSSSGLDTPGRADIVLTLNTESWYLEPNQINTYFIRNLNGYLRFTPGTLKWAGDPVIHLIFGSENRKEKYTPQSMLLNQLAGSRAEGPVTGTGDLSRQDHSLSETRLPFQLPAHNDPSARIRALEMVFPVEILHTQGYAELVIEHLSLSGFAEKKEGYGYPEISQYTVILKEGERSEPVQTDSPSGRGPFTTHARSDTPGISWSLEAGIRSYGTDQLLEMNLKHGAPETRYTGITSIEMILLVPDGSMRAGEVPSVQYGSSNVFTVSSGVPLVVLPPPPGGLYESLQQAAARSLMKEFGFEEQNTGKGMEYSNLLGYTWRWESGWDYHRFPLYQSSWNYPIVEGTGNLSIQVPVSVMNQDYGPAALYCRVSFLAGDQKGTLEKHEAILSFRNILQ